MPNISTKINILEKEVENLKIKILKEQNNTNKKLNKITKKLDEICDNNRKINVKSSYIKKKNKKVSIMDKIISFYIRRKKLNEIYKYSGYY